MIKKKLTTVLTAASLALATGLVATPAIAQKFITIGTGGVTGVYYPTGGAICRLVNKNRKEHGIRCSVESTGGSAYNVNTIRAGDLDMGVAQSDVQAAAFQGTLTFKERGAFNNLRAVFSVHPEPLHLIARADAGIKTFDDLKGKRVNIGNPGSGQAETVKLILQTVGWSKNDFSLASELKSAEQSAALCDNKVDAVFFTVGIPSGSIKEATTTCDTKLIPISGAWVDSFVKKYPAYAKATIPGGIYRGSPDPTATFGPKATFVSSTNTPDDTVYAVVKSVFENFESFKKLHPAFADLQRNEMTVDGLSAPLHNGAIRYYKEVGLM